MKPSADVKPMQQPNIPNEVRLPATGGVGNEFTSLFVLGISFIIAGAYVLRMKNRKNVEKTPCNRGVFSISTSSTNS